jgi:EpsI family protein
MEKIRNRYIIAFLAIALASFIVNYLDYSTYNKTGDGIQAIKGIPMEFGRWYGENMQLEERIYELLETKSIIHRKYYSDTGDEVFLSIVYHSETKVNFHSPEQCLGSQGIQLEKISKRISFKREDKIIEIKLNQLIQDQYGKKSLFYYFFKAGDFMGPSYIKLRLNIAMNKFTNKKKSGSLIRISTPVSNDHTQKSENVLTGFIEQLYPYLKLYL